MVDKTNKEFEQRALQTELAKRKVITDGELWLPTSKQAVVDMVVEALDDHASVVLVGEPGVGKTCVLRALRHRIPAAGFRLTYCHNATLGRRDFYRQLCHAVGLTPATTAGSLFYALSRHVEDSAAERVHPVFLLDEAHLLHQEALLASPTWTATGEARRARRQGQLVGSGGDDGAGRAALRSAALVPAAPASRDGVRRNPLEHLEALLDRWSVIEHLAVELGPGVEAVLWVARAKLARHRDLAG